MASSSYSADVFSRKEIIALLSRFQILGTEIANIREENLTNPSPDTVYLIYARLLIFVDSLQDDDSGQVEFVALEQLENPDFHRDSVHVFNFLRKIKELVAAVRVPFDFCLKDLIKPETRRTAVFMSAILNFCLYRESKMELMEVHVNEVNQHEERHQELQTRFSELNNEIANLNGATESEQPYVQELETEVRELRQSIHNLNSHQQSLKASFNTLKDKTNDIQEKISKANFTLIQSAQENAKLQSKIVQSPDKLQAALGVKKSILAEAKNSERSARQSFQEKTATLEVYEKALKKMSKHLVKMQAIQEQVGMYITIFPLIKLLAVNSAKTIDKDTKALKAKLSNEKVLEMSLEAKLVERQGKVEQLEESFKVFEKERDLKHDEASTKLSKVKLEVESKKHNNEMKERKIEAMVEEAGGINMEIDSVKDSAVSTQQELLRKAEAIVSEFHNYWESSEAAMQRIEAGLERGTESMFPH
ncbi:hypothetical protein GIB67_004599 [Kingdonia uniflora]|uniref:Kinetochore protein Nuf2 N-terminal domain-containing protein n=1 Tax=Kingdonia uniflora TaxID=39325 RepID=A0A7J7MDA4_9MAGN|nr:hypothetical protein GIB67_004599 [Kingdonia uniflora]